MKGAILLPLRPSVPFLIAMIEVTSCPSIACKQEKCFFLAVKADDSLPKGSVVICRLRGEDRGIL